MSSSSSNLDPFEMWREVVTKLENGINSMANKSMGSEDFTKSMHQFSQISTGMQQTFEKVLDEYFKAMRLPSRKDVLALDERLQRIEDKLDTLLPMEEREPPESRPLRTRQPSSPAQETVKDAVKAEASKDAAKRGGR